MLFAWHVNDLFSRWWSTLFLSNIKDKITYKIDTLTHVCVERDLCMSGLFTFRKSANRCPYWFILRMLFWIIHYHIIIISLSIIKPSEYIRLRNFRHIQKCIAGSWYDYQIDFGMWFILHYYKTMFYLCIYLLNVWKISCCIM